MLVLFLSSSTNRWATWQNSNSSAQFRYNMKMDELIKKNELLKQMVGIVLPIAESDPLHDTPLFTYRLVKSVLRKNIMRVQAIFVLNTYDKMSDSGLEIARNMIEDTISVSYILSDEDPEKLAQKFFEFRHIQAKQDLDYYSRIPDYLGEDLEKNRLSIDTEYKRVLAEHPEFTYDDGSPRHSWSKDGVEGMADKLRKRKLYNKTELRNMIRIYQRGSRKVHFNPEDLLNFYDQTTLDSKSMQSLEVTIKATAASLTSLVVRYFDTIKHYDKSTDGSEVIEQLYVILEQIHENVS